MAEFLVQKRRRFRPDADNPYKSRVIIYRLKNKAPNCDRSSYTLEIIQKDYVLQSVVAEDLQVVEGIESQVVGKQLVEYLLRVVREAKEAPVIYRDWKMGEIQIHGSNSNVLVKKAIEKRFARNLKRMKL